MLFIVLGSRAKNMGMVIMLVSVVIFLGYIFFKYNYNFATLKQKIMLKRRVDKIIGKKNSANKHTPERKNGLNGKLEEDNVNSSEEKVH